MSNIEINRENLGMWGFSPDEIDFILDPAYAEASRQAKVKMKALEEMILKRTDEINRILAPVGLRYDVRDIYAE